MSNGKKVIDFNKHLQDNFWLYMISLLCIFTGIVLGIYAVRYMGSGDNQSLVEYLDSFTQNISKGNFQYKSMFTDILKNNIPLIAAIWFLGLTMVGIPIILIIDVIKGFTIGFTISFMIRAFGTKGLGVVMLGVLPQNIVYIPCIILSSVVAMEFSLNILKDKMNKQWISSIWVRTASYSLVFVFLFSAMCFGFILETYVTPNLVKLVIV